MKRCIAIAAIVSLLTWTGAAQSQEAITIKLKVRGEGDSVLVKKNETVTSKVKVEDGTGKVLVEQNEKKTEVAEYQETVLKREPKKSPTKLERAYITMQTKKGDQTTVGPLQGKTVVIEKKGDKYAFAFKDGESVAGPAATALVKEFARKTDSNVDLDKLILPKTAVKVGDSWKLDMGPILKELIKDGEMDVDGAKAKGTGKLLKAYTKAGRRFGEMNYLIEMPLKSMGKGPQQMKFADGAKVAMNMTLDVCIDGTSEAGTIRISMNLNGIAALPQVPGGSATLNVVSETRGSQADVAKK